MDTETVDWTILESLRYQFLNGVEPGQVYWDSTTVLEHYDRFFAQRIGWKWEAVFRELKLRGWWPRSPTVLDWGCGTGIAARTLLKALPSLPWEEICLWDHSHRATAFAEARLRIEHPEFAGRIKTLPLVGDGYGEDESKPFTLILSHVWNELKPEDHNRLFQLGRKAQSILWVEPGAKDTSRGLIEMRERWLSTHFPVAPCPHAAGCGLLTGENQRHWCHGFARTPPEAHMDAQWAEFSNRLGIDLRSLPYSFLVMENRTTIPTDSALPENGMQRILGRPREYKGYQKALVCEEAGVSDKILQKRDDKALYKSFRKGKTLPLYFFQEKEEKINGGKSLDQEGLQ